MNRYIFPLILSTLLFADCPPTQKQQALKIWKNSIHQKTPNNKLSMLLKAEKFCPLDIIEIDKNIILAQANQLSHQEIVELRRDNDALDTEYSEHKWNNAKKIEKILGIKSVEYQDKKGLKAIQDIGGSYKADLLFNKNSFNIKDNAITQDIIEVINSEISFDKNSIFGLEGATSSEGDYLLNEKLSLKRANALKKAILKQYPQYRNNIRVFAMGERDLVCEDELLPERDDMGEYRCLTAENRIESRKVTIRRLK